MLLVLINTVLPKVALVTCIVVIWVKPVVYMRVGSEVEYGWFVFKSFTKSAVDETALQ